MKKLSFLFFLILNLFGSEIVGLENGIFNAGESVKLKAISESEIFWFSDVGKIELLEDNKSINYTLPIKDGVYSISIIDKNGTKTTKEFEVRNQIFGISPKYSTRLIDEEAIFTIIGKYKDEVTLRVDNNIEVEWLNDEQFKIKMPSYKIANFSIDITDKNNSKEESAFINVIEPMSLDSQNYSIKSNEELHLSIKGGYPPYFWIEGGKGKLFFNSNSEVIYTPIMKSGEDELLIMDSAGNSLNPKITTAGFFQISPRDYKAKCNQRVPISVSGGIPPYNLTSSLETYEEQGKLEIISKEEAKVIVKFLKPSGGVYYDIIAFDSNGNMSNGSIDVRCGELEIEANPIIVGSETQSVTLSVNNYDGEVEWYLDTSSKSLGKGTSIVLSPNDIKQAGIYEVSAYDESERIGKVKIYKTNSITPIDLANLYMSLNNRVTKEKLIEAIDDFGNSYISESVIFKLINYYEKANN